MVLEDDFQTAAEEAKALPSSVSNEDKLELYSLYKQATVGDCDVPKPGFLDFTGKAKWDAWDKKKGARVLLLSCFECEEEEEEMFKTGREKWCAL